MLIIFLLVAFAGWIIAALINLAVLDKGTPGLGLTQVLKIYWCANRFYLMSSFLVTAVLSYLLTIEGSKWFVAFITLQQLRGETPFEMYLFAFFIGLCPEFIIASIRKLKKPFTINVPKADQ